MEPTPKPTKLSEAIRLGAAAVPNQCSGSYLDWDEDELLAAIDAAADRGDPDTFKDVGVPIRACCAIGAAVVGYFFGGRVPLSNEDYDPLAVVRELTVAPGGDPSYGELIPAPAEMVAALDASGDRDLLTGDGLRQGSVFFVVTYCNDQLHWPLARIADHLASVGL